MAKRARKTTRKPKATGKFVVLHSGCGEAEQLSIINDGMGGQYSHPTAEAAKKTAATYMEYNGAEGTFVVAEILDVGKSMDVSWTGKQEL
jgi:hypothetical protein